MIYYFLSGVNESIKLLSEGRVVGFQKFKRFWDTGHGCGSWPNNMFKFLQRCELSFKQSLNMRVNLLFQLFILHTLNDTIHTKSSSCLRSFFLASFLPAAYVILKYF